MWQNVNNRCLLSKKNSTIQELIFLKISSEFKLFLKILKIR